MDRSTAILPGVCAHTHKGRTENTMKRSIATLDMR
jgi:hypothetical protein